MSAEIFFTISLINSTQNGVADKILLNAIRRSRIVGLRNYHNIIYNN